MKKTTVMFVAATAIMFAACGGKNDKANTGVESDSTTVAADSVAQAETVEDNSKIIDEKAISKINEFYKDYVLGNKSMTDAVASKYCTKKLAKKLADDYDYDDGGYAIWDFRSDSQDPEETKVLNVEPLGDGKYKVIMNANVTCVITVVVDGEEILFDEVNR